MDNILVLGDSHTYGDGLKDVGYEKPWEQHSVSTWPYHMFKKENIKNLSYPGCSNDMIFLRLVRYATKKDKVLIMFSYPERLHCTKKGLNFNVSHSFISAISDDYRENLIGEQIADKSKITSLINYFDDDLLEILFLKNILSCQTFCQSKNIKYYFTMVDFRKERRMGESLTLYRKGLHDSIDWNNIFLINEKYGFLNYASLVKAQHGLDGNHWNEDYHKTFGKLFLDWINKKKVL